MTLLTLKTWASKIYPDNPPALTTLRRWARNGNIYPPPELHGREYRVSPDAFYIRPDRVSKTLKQHHPNSRTGKISPLLERLINESEARSQLTEKSDIS
ncbi:excisionase [Salmonella bongori]|nr:excisionase [Salmonella bongori serovar 48:i:-]ECG9254754.1 excisionase [Salmonella bongori]EDP8708222.1 excisionase [Salmonella bongori]EDP8725842.1 excisionase [Salmonella bongori]